MRAYYAQFCDAKTMETAAKSTIYNKLYALYTVTAIWMEGCRMSLNRRGKYAMAGWLIPLVMVAALLWQSGALQQNAAMGYALLMGCMLLCAVWADRRQRQTETAGERMNFEKSEIPSARFSDVAANDEAMESLRDLVSFIREPEKYSRLGARIPRGVLLYGMPGTGKTLMARALAGEAGVPFFAVNGADFVEMYVGVGASRVRTLFRNARKAGRAVIFFDEIDAIGKKRDNRSDEREQTLNALLSEMSGFAEKDGIVVLAATNRADTLDEALLRAGRFDRQIEVPLPGQAERLQILQVHARKRPLSAEVSLPELARQTAMFSGARLECLLNEAAILAVKRDAEQIEPQDIQTAMDAALFGAERAGSSRMEHERRVTAAHEAGHAIATAVLLPESELRKVSIIPTSRGAAGYSMALPPEKMFHEQQELICHIAVALAGREAERRLLGNDRVSTGASNDIEKAVLLARRMVNEWGMLPASVEVFLMNQQQKDMAAQQWLNEAQCMAAEVLEKQHDAWIKLTDRLLEQETADGQTVLACFDAGTQPC